MIEKELISLSHSKISAYFYCNQKYIFAYKEYLVPVIPSKNLMLGDIFHKGRELQSSDQALDYADKKYLEIPKKERVMAKAMIDGANKRWPQPKYPEVNLAYMLKTMPVILTGKADGVDNLEHPYMIDEYKTTSSFGEPINLILSGDNQHRMYAFILWKVTGCKPQKIRFSRILKSQIRPKNNKKTGEESFDDFLVRLNEAYETNDMYEQETQDIYWLDYFVDNLKPQIMQILENKHICRSWRCNQDRMFPCEYRPLCMKEANAENLFKVQPEQEEPAKYIVEKIG